MTDKNLLQKHKMYTNNNQTLLALNYWALLASQVEELEQIPPKPPELKLLPSPRHFSKNGNEKKVFFSLPTDHRDTNGIIWRASQYVTINLRRQRAGRRKLSKTQIAEGIRNGKIPSGVSDTGATSNAGKATDPFGPSRSKTTNFFRLPTGGTTTSTHQAKLLLPVRAPANVVDVIPDLDQTLISGSKFADAGYTAVYDQQEVNFYDSNKIKITAKSVLQGYRCPRTGMWRVPLQYHIQNDNTDTIILNAKQGQ